MKAHINQQAARPLALLYGLPESTETGRGVRAALEEQGFSSKEIAPEQLLQPVGALAGLGGKAAPLYSGEAPDAQLLLMSNFTSPQLNAVLDALREAGVHVPLKAVVTKHNKTWSVLALLEELQREREATRRFENAPRRGGNRKGKYSMDFAPIIADVKAAKCAGFRYQRAGHQRYRDRVTVYRDGRLLFERFCYGEAAGLVFKLWAPGADDTGVPQWDFSKCNVTNARDEVPHQLTGAGQGGLCLTAGPRAGSVWTS